MWPCVGSAFPSLTCPLPIWLNVRRTRVLQPCGCSRPGDWGTPVPGAPVPLLRAPSSPQRIGCCCSAPPGCPVPGAAADLPCPALSKRISGRGASMERRAAAAGRGGGGGGRERLVRYRLAQRRGWALQREPGALRTVREPEAEGAEMRLLPPLCWISWSLARRREEGKLRPPRRSAGAKGACVVPSSCFYPSPGAEGATAPSPCAFPTMSGAVFTL